MQINSDTKTTTGALRALLANLIDYAGLFPPAALQLPDVVRNYAQYFEHSDAWMLARLIIPTSKLDEFERAARDLLPNDDDSEPWCISALIKSTAPADLDPAIECIQAFNMKHASSDNGLAVVETIELKAESASQIDHALDIIPDEVFPFFEIASDADPRGMIAALTGSEAGAKVRTGGVTPDLYPSTKNVARFIQTCAAANIPFKATAGLHHPLYHRNEAVPADEFGFLNMFIAACAAKLTDIHTAQIGELLTETTIDAFTFTDEAITWRDITLPADAVDDCRNTFAVSFGSCSFDEPREDLRRLNLLS